LRLATQKAARLSAAAAAAAAAVGIAEAAPVQVHMQAALKGTQLQESHCNGTT
jgi:hypothetical protein